MDDNQTKADVLTGKGAMHVIYVTGAHGTARFSELFDHLPVSNPTTTARLNDLVEANLLTRTERQNDAPRVDYALTSNAESLYQHLSSLFEWLADYSKNLQGDTAVPTNQEAGEQQCVCCPTTKQSEGEDVDEDARSYRTIDGLVGMLRKSYAMEIIVYLGTEEPARHIEIKDWIDVSSDTAFSTRLKELEEAGFIDRQSFDEVPPHVEYTLTDEGRELETYVRPVVQWCNQMEA